MRIVIRAVLALVFCLLAGWAQAGTYYPKAGDTLSALARHVRSDVPCLMSLNKGVITDPNKIYVGRPIELGRCDKDRVRANAPLPSISLEASEDSAIVWLPSRATACTDCEARSLIAQRFPDDVVERLLFETETSEGTSVTVTSGETFASLQRDANHVALNAKAIWTDGTVRTATRYVVRARGLEYALIRHEFGGWAIKDPTPDIDAYRRIRDELAAASDERASPAAIDLIARLIWWRRMIQGFEDPDRQRAHALWVTAGLPGYPLPIP